jgi:hypothetical protein
MPLILLARPTPAGERVWVWLRPGLDLSDLEGRIPKLAVACWASQARVVHASKRFAALIRVDLARRDPLVTGVASPLPGLVDLPDDFEPHNLRDQDTIPSALDLADVPDPAEEPPQRTRPERALRSVPRQRKAADSSDDEYDAFI